MRIDDEYEKTAGSIVNCVCDTNYGAFSFFILHTFYVILLLSAKECMAEQFLGKALICLWILFLPLEQVRCGELM